jgi:hypothetical protein
MLLNPWTFSPSTVRSSRGQYVPPTIGLPSSVRNIDSGHPPRAPGKVCSAVM